MMVNDTSLAPVTDRVMTLTSQILARNGGDRAFAADDALVDVGLTSLDLVNLMIAVEAEFDILIPPNELSPKNFYSAATVARMVLSVKSDDPALEHA